MSTQKCKYSPRNIEINKIKNTCKKDKKLKENDINCTLSEKNYCILKPVQPVQPVQPDNSDSYNDISKSFSKLMNNKKKINFIKEGINSFNFENTKASNDSENKKKELLLEYLHTINDNDIIELSDNEKLFLNKLKTEWFKIIKDVFSIDVNNKDTSFEIRRPISANHPYDFRFKFKNKNNKIIQKKVEFKFTKNGNIPQLYDKNFRQLEYLYDDYSIFFYNEYIDKIMELLPTVEKIPIENYLKQVYKPKCYELDFFKELETIRKTPNFLKIENESRIEYIKKIFTDNLKIKAMYKDLFKKQENKHFFIWNKSNSNFEYKTISSEKLKLIELGKAEIKQSSKENYSFLVIDTNTGKKLFQISLYWKNHTGVCNPYLKLKPYWNNIT